MIPEHFTGVDLGVGSEDWTHHQELDKAVALYKKLKYAFLRAKYHELLTVVIEHVNVPHTVHELKMEHFLRSGHDLAFGRCLDGYDRVVGYVKNPVTNSNPEQLWQMSARLKGKDIIPMVSSALFDFDRAREISPDWDAEGSFVVMRNKPIHRQNDYSLIDLSCLKLSEIEATIYSLIWQSKAIIAFQGEENDEDVISAINAFFNGNPFLAVGLGYDLTDMIKTFDNSHLSQNLSKLTEQYRDEENNLLSYFGINSVGTSKASGVSDLEASSSSLATTAFANIHLSARNLAYDLFNAKFGTRYFCKIRDNLNEPDALNQTEEVEDDGNAL